MRRRNFLRGAFGLVAYAAMNMQMLRAEKSPTQIALEGEPDIDIEKINWAAFNKQFDEFIRDNYYIGSSRWPTLK